MSFRHLVYDEPNEPKQNIVVVHFTLDCVDAMGANMVNTLQELSPHIERLVGQPTTLESIKLCNRAMFTFLVLYSRWIIISKTQISNGKCSCEEHRGT